ncbi:MAG: hypothetical protein XE11_2234 [Methanomicrobiales archaeon 53_19]|jgi:hypothetical protein|uniref:hypothetical protein n=1 Tax=Methanocalculus sp. TaxID=2004547 RepID=UPI0007494665|nr:hypothetical protein [Methanocalculus sp.]KUK68964.1 MAG: hypothetical protein XD88_1640 [Methanocalculus sp. 52_23]KUL01111.1 MAG: hypothetical protein XE11_2234 [Methanomicrobiales archaeon 53_19]HIJ07230.1 hypothetical protein [Methanocalculus sp.]
METKRDGECNTFAVAPGEKVDILELEELGSRYGIDIYLYFEEDLARNSTLQKDMEDFKSVPEYERPFILLGKFIAFAASQDPKFRDKLKELPLILEVIACGESTIGGTDHRYITTLMPFLQDMDALEI